MLPKLTDHILEDWNDLFPGLNKPDSISYLGIMGSVEGGTTTFLAFTEKNSKPIFVVKIHRYPDVQEKVFSERDVLNFLQAKGGVLSASVPRLIFYKKISGVWMLVQTIIEGHPLSAAMGDNGLPEIKSAITNINLSANWLTKLHSIIPPDTSVEVSRQLIKGALETIELCSQIFSLSRNDRVFLEEIAGSLNIVLKRGAFIQHGDFCRHNIMLAGNGSTMKVGVIDWTDSKRFGFPLHDLFFYLTTYYLQIRKYHGINGFIKAFEDTFLNVNPYSDKVKSCLIEYCSQFNIDLSNVRLLFGIFLINQTLFEYKKVLQCLGSGGLPRFSVYLGLNKNKDYPEVLKEQLWVYFFHTFVKQRHQFII